MTAGLSLVGRISRQGILKTRVCMLPTCQWRYAVITIPDGVLDHEEAIKRGAGGQVLGYFH